MTQPDLRTPPAPRLTARSVVMGLVFSVALCAMNSYLTLKFGVIEEGPTIAALFFFALFFLSRTKITTTEMVTVATMGSAGGSFGFISNFFAAQAMIGAPYSIVQMVAFGVVSSLVGIVMVIPLRQLLILREELPWPQAKATAGVITALVEEGDPRQPKILAVTLILMMAVVICNTDGGYGLIPDQIALPGLAAVGGAIALSPFSIGGSYLMGFRTCVGFLVGAIVLMIMAPHTPTPETPHKYFWPGLGFLMAAGLVGMAMNWRSLVGAFKSMTAMGQRTDDDDPVMPGRRLLVFAAIAFTLACVVMPSLFGLSVGLVVVLIAIGGLIQNVIATRAQAQTSFNPARVMGVMVQGVASLFGGGPATNLSGAGMVAGSGAQAGMLTADMAYGRMFRVPSRWQFWMQLATVVPCTVVAALVFQSLAQRYSMTLDTELPAGVAKLWAASALVFAEGRSALPPGAIQALLIGAGAGAVYALLEHIPALRRWMPETTGIGIGMVLWVSTDIAFFIGGFLMWIVLGRWAKTSDTTLTTLAVGCIVAEGIGGVIKPFLQMLKLLS